VKPRLRWKKRQAAYYEIIRHWQRWAKRAIRVINEGRTGLTIRYVDDASWLQARIPTSEAEKW